MTVERAVGRKSVVAVVAANYSIAFMAFPAT
jgi:hypothetical protein